MCIIGRHSIYSVAFRPPHAHGHSVVQSPKGRHDGAGPWSGCRRPPRSAPRALHRRAGVGGGRPPSPQLPRLPRDRRKPPHVGGGGGLDGMFARLFSRQVACGTILTASKSQGIHACFCELLFVSGCGWHHVDRLDTSGNRDGVFCKFVCVQARFAPFLPSPNFRESRRSFCKCLPFLNQNRDGIFPSVCLRQGAFRPHLYRLGISRNRDCLFARFYHPKITMEIMFLQVVVCVRARSAPICTVSKSQNFETACCVTANCCN